jgi:hypothetical protein
MIEEISLKRKIGVSIAIIILMIFILGFMIRGKISGAVPEETTTTTTTVKPQRDPSGWTDNVTSPIGIIGALDESFGGMITLMILILPLVIIGVTLSSFRRRW